MKKASRQLSIVVALGWLSLAPAAVHGAEPYKILTTAQFMGTGGLDYVYADNIGRRLYIPRGAAVQVFDLDSLKSVGSITNTRARGVAVDPNSHHGFASSKPVAMWDTRTLEMIKTIDVQGNPDGILFEPFTERIYVLSHASPNVTVIEAKDGTVVGTIDLGGAPEQGQSDGMGHVYIDVEDKANVAVVDTKTLTVTAHYDLSAKASTPAGLALDITNHILFAMCRQPPSCIILDANDGKILINLPLAGGSDGAVFNPATMEAFSSHGNGTLSVIKESSPTNFEIEQTVTTKPGAKTLTLDSKNNHVIVITTERPPVAAATNAPVGTSRATNAAPGSQRGGRGNSNAPAFLDILVIGR
jgi:DNA-binding beta-propeller fold protein YncE